MERLNRVTKEKIRRKKKKRRRIAQIINVEAQSWKKWK